MAQTRLEQPLLAFPDFGEGGCINCGFLSKRLPDPHDTACHEVTMDERAGGNLDLPRSNPQMWCFARAANLHKEAKSLGDPPVGVGLYKDEWVTQVIQKGRDCWLFYPWREGYSPKDHSDELMARRLEESRRVFEERTEQARMRFEKHQERRRRRFEEELHSETQQTQLEMVRVANRQSRLAVGAIAVAVLLTISATLVTVRCTENRVVVELPKNTPVATVPIETAPLRSVS